MKLEWEGEEDDRIAAIAAADERQRLEDQRVGAPISIANEFSEIRVSRVETRNGSRLLIESPRSGQWVALDPLELEALTLADYGDVLRHDRPTVRTDVP